MFYSIPAIHLLKFDCFPSHQDCKDVLKPFNPFACNVYVSHKWVSRDCPDDGRYYRHFVNCLLRMINRCCINKFLERAELRFDPEYVFDHTAGMDLYRQILEPTEEDLFMLGQYLDTDLLSLDMQTEILAYLNDCFIFCDCSCLPQAPFLSNDDKIWHDSALRAMSSVIENSLTICLWEGEEITIGWNLMELIMSLRINSVLLYHITDFDLRQHQINAKHVVVATYDLYATAQNEAISNRMANTSILIEDASVAIRSNNSQPVVQAFFENLNELPSFVLDIFRADGESEIRDIFSANNIVIASSFGRQDNDLDIATIVQLIAKYIDKYSGFALFNPIFMTRVPRDFRTKLITTLKALHDGGEHMLSPVLFDYVAVPSSKVNMTKYLTILSTSLQDPFYADFMVRYFACPLQTRDPYLLIRACFQLQEMRGTVFNDDLVIKQLTQETLPLFARHMEFTVRERAVVKLPVIRCNFSFSLGVCHESVLTMLDCYKDAKDHARSQFVVYRGVFSKHARNRGLMGLFNTASNIWKERTIVIYGDHKLRYFQGENNCKGEIQLSPRASAAFVEYDHAPDKLCLHRFLRIVDGNHSEEEQPKQVLLLASPLDEQGQQLINALNMIDLQFEAKWVGLFIETMSASLLESVMDVLISSDAYYKAFLKVITPKD